MLSTDACEGYGQEGGGADCFSSFQELVNCGCGAGAGGPAMLVYANEGDRGFGGNSGVEKSAWHSMVRSNLVCWQSAGGSYAQYALLALVPNELVKVQWVS